MIVKASPGYGASDDAWLEKRLRQEMAAALRSEDAKAAAVHVDLANRYLVQLNRDKAGRSEPLHR